MIKLEYHPHFIKKLKKKVPANLHAKVKEKLSLLCKDPRYPSLNFESLSGYPDCFTIRLNCYWRIHLRKISDEHYQVFSVESHDAYKAKALKSHSKKKIH